MDQKDKIIITLLARIVGHLEGIPADEVIRVVTEAAKPKEKELREPDQTIVERLYKLYPTSCPITGRSLGKGAKNKKQIITLLKKHTPQEIETAIKMYIDDCKEHNSYVKNFSTFLNNLPDYSAGKEPEISFEDSLREQGYK